MRKCFVSVSVRVCVCVCVCVRWKSADNSLCLMKINFVISADSPLQEQQPFQSISAQISAIYNSTDTRTTKRERDALVAIWGVTRATLCSIWDHRVKVRACVSLKTGQQLRWLKQNVLEDGSFRRSVFTSLCICLCVTWDPAGLWPLNSSAAMPRACQIQEPSILNAKYTHTAATTVDPVCALKRTVHPKIKSSVIIYSPSCCFKVLHSSEEHIWRCEAECAINAPYGSYAIFQVF